MRTRAFVCALAVFALGPRAARAACPDQARPSQQVGVVSSDQLVEASGLAASRRHPSVLWTHNDSGGQARLFAIDEQTAQIVATVDVQGAEAIDWEDIAVGPCGEGDARSCVAIGDIGDNLHRRDQVVIYRAPEPQRLGDPIDAIEVIEVRYPSQPNDLPQVARPDAESLMIHPLTGQIYVITKEGAGARLFRVPEQGAAPRTLELVASLDVTGATGADMAPEGGLFVVRNYALRVVFSLSGEGADEVEFVASWRLLREPQGEAIAFDDASSDRLYTLSEGVNQPLRRYVCPEIDGARDMGILGMDAEDMGAADMDRDASREDGGTYLADRGVEVSEGEGNNGASQGCSCGTLGARGPQPTHLIWIVVAGYVGARRRRRGR